MSLQRTFRRTARSPFKFLAAVGRLIGWAGSLSDIKPLKKKLDGPRLECLLIVM